MLLYVHTNARTRTHSRFLTNGNETTTHPTRIVRPRRRRSKLLSQADIGVFILVLCLHRTSGMWMVRLCRDRLYTSRTMARETAGCICIFRHTKATYSHCNTWSCPALRKHDCTICGYESAFHGFPAQMQRLNEPDELFFAGPIANTDANAINPEIFAKQPISILALE